MYKIQLTKDAAKYYQKSDTTIKRKLNRCFGILKNNPHSHANIKRLHGELTGSYRYRTGPLRIIYKIDEENIMVIVIAIGSRGDVYK